MKKIEILDNDQIRQLPTQLLFLPGASGQTDFWQPVAGLLNPMLGKQIFCGWAGFGDTPADPSINSFADLVASVIHRIDHPTALIAQSMGCVIALQTALARPDLITHLVLTATSGGINIDALGGQDWRPEFQHNYPNVPDWFATEQVELSNYLPTIQIPTLLLWGDEDSISPVAVGQQLLSLLPMAELQIFSGGKHDLANTFAADIAPLIEKHLHKSLRLFKKSFG